MSESGGSGFKTTLLPLQQLVSADRLPPVAAAGVSLAKIVLGMVGSEGII